MSHKINESSFIIVGNGFADGPSQALRDYLLKKKAKRVITVSHPLVPEGSNRHQIVTYEAGKKTRREIALPHKPPYTYALDPFIPLSLPKSTAWFGFNNLAAYRGLLRRRQGKVDKVYYWAVDFVANRFGKSLATKAYDRVDKIVCKKADGRAELSSVGVTSRNRHLGLEPKDIAPTQVIPMGAWLDRTPKVPASAWDKHRLVYLGHLVERQGVQNLIKVAEILHKRGGKFSLEVIGAGPLLEELKKMADDAGLEKIVTFHGFVKDHKDVEKILASGTLAVAPYRQEKNFVQFTDAGKLKAYLGAYLPIVLTNVPNNAQELQEKGAAFIAEDDPADLAKVIESVLFDKAKWQKAHRAAQTVAKEFDWNAILKTALKNFGFD